MPRRGEGGKKERCRGKTVEWRNRAKLSTSPVIRRFSNPLEKGVGKERERERKKGGGFESYVNYEELQAFY